MNKVNPCFTDDNCQNIKDKCNSCCDFFLCNPINPTQNQWSKICDYFNIGDSAPCFDLEGVYLGKLIKVNLNQYLGKWVALFFYNSDFTFV